jgi:hypothetical protein
VIACPAAVGGPQADLGRAVRQPVVTKGVLGWVGADTVVLDPHNGDPEQTRLPAGSWRALTAVATHWRTAP